MHFSAPRLSWSKPTPPWTAWKSAGVHAMCNGSIFNIGTNFISCTLMKNALQWPQTLLFQANLSLNCLDVWFEVRMSREYYRSRLSSESYKFLSRLSSHLRQDVLLSWYLSILATTLRFSKIDLLLEFRNHNYGSVMANGVRKVLLMSFESSSYSG